MFYNCTSLSNFYGGSDGLKSLSAGYNMFDECKLDYASVQHIADTLPTVTGTHNINIGYDPNKITAEQKDACNTTIAGKGWTVTWQSNS